LWEKTKSREDRDNAIAAYRKYLELAPPNAEWRPQAEHLIKMLEKER